MEFNIDKLLEDAPNLIVTYGVQLITALAIFIIGKWLARAIANAITNSMNKKNVDKTISNFVGSIIYTALFAFAIIAALGQIGIETASFVAIIGAAGLAVGFALQGSLSNFASGVLLILFRPIRSGDFVEAAGEMGVIDEVGIFSTKMKTGDNKVIIIPNSNIMGGNITNYSMEATRRIDLIVGIGYDADIRKAKHVLEEIINNESRVLKDPAVTIAVAELADSSVNFVVRPWVNSADYWPTKFELLETIKLRFDQEGISIPFPQMDVHLQQQ
ncbi:mechanosensitive ion channel family protein [Oceanicoccus sagamiensis]|uniref:Small-conductance mechanosensitive channel n=1 Tax=Oceanicoccus sagamiensis TaxID=716816 RepID=A0A1X9N943_9GAMM|nr:mechanosensitive ion channel domain-containing protein [Oceanicoccus sagamiensis]ARN74580.1 mechanosensitive ion channel protein [Oceanicoccus sagamiensis]